MNRLLAYYVFQSNHQRQFWCPIKALLFFVTNLTCLRIRKKNKQTKKQRQKKIPPYNRMGHCKIHLSSPFPCI